MANVEWFSPGSLSFAIAANSIGAAAGIVTALLAFVIARAQKNIASEQKDIASRQRDISEGKLRLDLFERRYDVFFATWGFLSSPLIDEIKEPAAFEFTNLLSKAEFLFGREIRAYMAEASTNLTQLWGIERQIAAGTGSLIEAQAESLRLHLWFEDQAKEGCRAKFAPYLDFSEWR